MDFAFGGLMITIGIVEDEPYLYYPWEIACKTASKACCMKWFSDFETCLREMKECQILVLDRQVKLQTSSQIQMLDDYLDEIRDNFSGPLVLNSVLALADLDPAPFKVILEDPLKAPPDIDQLLSQLCK